MNGRAVVCVASLMVSSALLLGREASAQVTGTLTHNGTVMPVKAAVAVWDAKRPALKVHFLPFVPSAQETAALQKNDTFWMLDKPSSDPKKWPASPHGSITLSWSFDPKSAGNLAKAWADVYAFGIGRPNSNLNSSLTEGELKGSLTGPVKDGSTVTFDSAGSADFEKDKLAWDVKVTTKVLPALAK
jgi:hypothetical protein